MDNQPSAVAVGANDDSPVLEAQEWAGLSRPEAVALFWEMSRRVAAEIQALRKLQKDIGERWGRAPRLPKWDTRAEGR